MTHRTPLRADLIRDRNALYRELPGDMIENVYTLKITNMDSTEHQYRLIAPGESLVDIELSRPLRLAAEEVSGFPVRIRVPRQAGQGVQSLELKLVSEGNPDISSTLDAKILQPVN